MLNIGAFHCKSHILKTRMSVYVKSHRLKRCVFSSFLNNANVRLSMDVFGNEFHTAGPACEKARSPNLVRSK